MYGAAFQLDSFEALPPEDQCTLMGALVEALAGVNRAFLLGNSVPRLYDSGVRYANPPKAGPTYQPWRDVPLLLRSGSGTCHELTAWRLAELRLFYGKRDARPLVSCREMGGGLVFHVKIVDGRGAIEDPSANLGMGADEWSPFF